MSQYDYDLIILGSGPGGYVSAIRASQLKMKVAVIEKDKPGGVCLNVGCIPSKALIHQAEIFSHINDLKKMGVQVDVSNFDYKAVHAKSRKAATLLSKGVQFLLKKNNVTYIESEGKINSPHDVVLSDGKKISAKNIMIATGSRPKEIPAFPFDEKKVLSSTGILMQEQLPKRLLILGAGAIGVEFAHILSSFGVEVYLVEALDQILPMEDAEVVNVVTQSFTKRKIKVLTSCKALSMNQNAQGVKVQLETSDAKSLEIEVNQILIAVGRSSNTENIGLDTVNLELDHGFIPVKDYYQTAIESIYAIGDVINTPQLAHVASKEGEIAVEYMAGHHPLPKIDPKIVPCCVYSEPQIASFGYREKELIDQNLAYQKGVFPYRGIGKAVAIEQSEGIIKILYSKETKEILGTHIVGAQATELIHEILLAKTAELLPEDIATMIHAHPTLSESVMEVMRVIEGWPIHI